MKKKMSSLSWEILKVILNEAIKDLSMCPWKKLVLLTSARPKDQQLFHNCTSQLESFLGRLETAVSKTEVGRGKQEWAKLTSLPLFLGVADGSSASGPPGEQEKNA